jgi:hypothetical protein
MTTRARDIAPTELQRLFSIAVKLALGKKRFEKKR